MAQLGEGECGMGGPRLIFLGAELQLLEVQVAEALCRSRNATQALRRDVVATWHLGFGGGGAGRRGGIWVTGGRLAGVWLCCDPRVLALLLLVRSFSGYQLQRGQLHFVAGEF
jgi:hypothetical protein